MRVGKELEPLFMSAAAASDVFHNEHATLREVVERLRPLRGQGDSGFLTSGLQIVFHLLAFAISSDDDCPRLLLSVIGQAEIKLAKPLPASGGFRVFRLQVVIGIVGHRLAKHFRDQLVSPGRLNTKASAVAKSLRPSPYAPKYRHHLYKRKCPGEYCISGAIMKKKNLFVSKKGQLPTLPHCIAVPSAQAGLTSLFGMGRGGTPPQ